MEQIENICSEITVWELDIPIWNIRTNQFYKKMGYTEIKRDEEFVFYRKSRQTLKYVKLEKGNVW